MVVQVKKLNILRKKFLDFIDELDLGGHDLKNKHLDNIKNSVVNESRNSNNFGCTI